MNDLIPAGFELNNLHRRYLGLNEVMPHWDRIILNNKVVLYFDGDIIRKMIEYTVFGEYQETDHYEMTSENRTILLPKTKRGKPKKLNYTATQSFSYKGVYFSFSARAILLGNFTTQTTFYYEDNDSELTIEEWLDNWIKETTEQNLVDLDIFKNSTRKHQKYAEGDFFAFKVGRNKWGFGRIVLNIAERRKSEIFNRSNHGLTNLMGKALYIAIYRKLSDKPDIDIDELRQYSMLPTQAIMDNRLYYGEYKIIGNRSLEPNEWEPIISYSNSTETKYLQYGLICKERKTGLHNKYLKSNNNNYNIFRNESIGFGIDHYSNLEKIITENIDNDSLLYKNDLRKRSNIRVKRTIFRDFGLDANKSYAENLRSVEEAEIQKKTPRKKWDLLYFLKNKFR